MYIKSIPVITLPMSWQNVFAFNFGSVALVYGGSHALLYNQKSRATFSKHKFNPKYPSDDLVSLEIQRSLVSVLICCLYEVYIGALCYYPHPAATTATVDILTTIRTTQSNWGTIACTAIGIFLWSDTRFYFVHRLLHEIPVLYRRVHKVHHESYNPDPWSGLSFHPIEAILYFSSLLIAHVLPIPYWAFCLHKTALLLTPANGHHGHDVVVLSCLFGSEHHYLHHARFDCNYGSPTPFWDWIFGTLGRGSRRSEVAEAPIIWPSGSACLATKSN